MKIIAVTNRKGGVGKSTISVHLAAGLATQGARVGLVDTDSQGHTGLMLGMSEANGLFNVMIGKQSLSDNVLLVSSEQYSTPDHPSKGALYLLPSSDNTYKIPYELGQDESFLFLETLEEMAQQWSLDVILIDTNPTMTMFDGAVYLAADGYLYVTECERMAFDGVKRAVEQAERFNKSRQRYLGRSSSILGIIPNKLRAKTFVHRDNIGKLALEYPGLVWSPLSLRTIWTEASNALQTVFTYYPTGQEAREAWGIVQRTAGALQAWETTDSAKR